MKVYKLIRLGFCEHKIIFVFAKNEDEAVEIANKGQFGSIFDKSDIAHIITKSCVISCDTI